MIELGEDSRQESNNVVVNVAAVIHDAATKKAA